MPGTEQMGVFGRHRPPSGPGGARRFLFGLRRGTVPAPVPAPRGPSLYAEVHV